VLLDGLVRLVHETIGLGLWSPEEAGAAGGEQQ
jgi:hypothetical protein